MPTYSQNGDFIEEPEFQTLSGRPAQVSAPAGQSLPGLSFHPLKQIYAEELRRAGFGGYSDAEQTKPVGGLDLASASVEQLEAKLREIGKNPEQVVQEFRNAPENAKLFPPGYGNLVDDPTHGRSLTMQYQPEWDEDDPVGGLILKAMIAGVGGLSGGLGELFGTPPVDDPWGVRNGPGYTGNRLAGIPGVEAGGGLAEGAFPGVELPGGSIVDSGLLPGSAATTLTGLGEGAFPGGGLPGPEIIDPSTLPASGLPLQTLPLGGQGEGSFPGAELPGPEIIDPATLPATTNLPVGPLGEAGFPGTEPVGPDIVDPATLPSGSPVIPPMPPAPPVDPTGGEPLPPAPPGTPGTEGDWLQRVLSGAGTAADIARLVGMGGAGLLGLLGAQDAKDAAEKDRAQRQSMYDEYKGFGAPGRQRLADLYANPNSFLTSDRVRLPVEQATRLRANALSTQGNPAVSPNANQEIQTFAANTLFDKFGQEADRYAREGGLTAYNQAAAGYTPSATPNNSQAYQTLGGVVGDIFNPPKSYAQQRAEYDSIYNRRLGG